MIKAKCKRGHEFTPSNTILRAGSRYCRECMKLHNKNRKWAGGHYVRKNTYLRIG